MSDPRLPRYRQIRDEIARNIASQTWRQGEAIPNETELAKTHRVAIGTIRQAIDLLTAEGLLERIHGKGTFVRRPSFSSSLFRFFRHHSETGEPLMPSGRVLERRRAPAPAEVRRALLLRPEAGAIRMKRLRKLGRDVVLLEEIWLPEERFAGILKVDPTQLEPLLYPAYETLFKVLVTRAEETLSVSLASPSVAKMLGLEKGDPLMVIERCAFDQDGRPVEWRRSLGSATSFRYKVEVR